MDDDSRARNFHASLVRSYDLRGRIGETLFPEDALALGLAFGSVAGEHAETENKPRARICVARDTRLSSPELEEALITGLVATGAEVLRLGVAPSPALYYAVHKLEATAGVVITGSHNPAPEDNGFKLVLGEAALHGEALQALGARAARGSFRLRDGGRARDHDILDAWCDRLLEDLPALPTGTTLPTTVWDAAGGAMTAVLPRFLARLPGRHALIGGEPDGTFGGRSPDPTSRANLEPLAQACARAGGALGFGFDGDGDRLGVLTASGEMISGEWLLVLFARAILAEHPHAKIVADIKTSPRVVRALTQAGAHVLLNPSGHSLIRDRVRAEGAAVAGELSGHFFFAHNFYGHDDALYAAVRLYAACARLRLSLETFAASIPHAGERATFKLACPESEKPARSARFARAAASLATHTHTEAGASWTTIDGVRREAADGWWLVRASNTEPIVGVILEADSPDAFARLRAELAGLLGAAGFALP